MSKSDSVGTGLLEGLPGKLIFEILNQDPAPRHLVDLVQYAPGDVIRRLLANSKKESDYYSVADWEYQLARWNIAARSDRSDKELRKLFTDDIKDGDKTDRFRSSLTQRRVFEYKHTHPRVLEVVVDLLCEKGPLDSHTQYEVKDAAGKDTLSVSAMAKLLANITQIPRDQDTYERNQVQAAIMGSLWRKGGLEEALATTPACGELIYAFSLKDAEGVKVPDWWMKDALDRLETMDMYHWWLGLLEASSPEFHVRTIQAMREIPDALEHVNECDHCQGQAISEEIVKRETLTSLTNRGGWSLAKAGELLSKAANDDLNYWKLLTSVGLQGPKEEYPLGDLLAISEEVLGKKKKKN